MKFSIALSILLAALIVEAVPAPQDTAIPRLQPAKVTPKQTTPKTNNAAVDVKQFGSNGGAVPNSKVRQSVCAPCASG